MNRSPGCDTIKDVIVYKRTGSQVNMQSGRDHYWHELESALDPATANDCPAVELDSEHPLYVLYTSGTTGKPKESFTPRLDTTSTPT